MRGNNGETIYRKIILTGLVQGVGFRPHVLNLARRLGVVGGVRNNDGAVEILVAGEKSTVEIFEGELRSIRLPHARIDAMEIAEAEPFEAVDFAIWKSDVTPRGRGTFISPDLPVCERCLSEMNEAGNRRAGHHFISCVSCGPRYMIVTGLPYDRENTTMAAFPMCDACREEYVEPSDIRCHAQTVSCRECGPYSIYRGPDGAYTHEEALEKTASALCGGAVVAVKGIGGYHLVCSPYDEGALSALRRHKGRDRKPFAVMFPDMESIESACFVDEREKELLRSTERPIVLLRFRENTFCDGVAGGALCCGCFLPYTPVQVLLTARCGPLVFTSGNESDAPIATDDGEMLALADAIGIGILYHERKILRGLDDSVARIAGGETQVLRRGRGYTPVPLRLDRGGARRIFAAGGDLKSSFCLLEGDLAYVGPHVGDLADLRVNERYRGMIAGWFRLFGFTPDCAVCDPHPGYYSAEAARELGVPVTYVQHHHAHIGAVLAEHGLREPAIGVAFDGTGYGTDGCVWGGELFLRRGGRFDRVAHLRYATILGGDDSMKDAERTALCLLLSNGLPPTSGDREKRAIVEAALVAGVNTVRTSSMGRLFDAASCLLGICGRNGYEGECATLLEREAQKAADEGVPPCPMSFALFEGESGGIEIDFRNILETLRDRKQGERIGPLALGFHLAIADMTLEVCRRVREREGVNVVALSGGVFQNGLLLAAVTRRLAADGFLVYRNILYPPNDGCIGLGQAYLAAEGYEGQGGV